MNGEWAMASAQRICFLCRQPIKNGESYSGLDHRNLWFHRSADGSPTECLDYVVDKVRGLVRAVP